MLFQSYFQLSLNCQQRLNQKLEAIHTLLRNPGEKYLVRIVTNYFKLSEIRVLPFKYLKVS